MSQIRSKDDILTRHENDGRSNSKDILISKEKNDSGIDDDGLLDTSGYGEGHIHMSGDIAWIAKEIEDDEALVDDILIAREEEVMAREALLNLSQESSVRRRMRHQSAGPMRRRDLIPKGDEEFMDHSGIQNNRRCQSAQIELLFPRLPGPMKESLALRRNSPLVLDWSHAPAVLQQQQNRQRQSSKERRRAKSAPVSDATLRLSVNSLRSSKSDRPKCSIIAQAPSFTDERELDRRRLEREQKCIKNEIKSTRIMLSRVLERKELKEHMRLEKLRRFETEANYRQKKQMQWKRKMSSSPFHTDLVAKADYNEHRNKFRDYVEQKRQEEAKKSKAEFEKKVIVSSLLQAPNSNNEVLRYHRRLFFEEYKRRRALESVKRKEIVQENQKRKAELIRLERIQKLELRALQQSM